MQQVPLQQKELMSGLKVTSVIAVPHSDPADKAKKLVEEVCFHGPTTLKVAMSLRKYRTRSGQTLSKTF